MVGDQTGAASEAGAASEIYQRNVEPAPPAKKRLRTDLRTIGPVAALAYAPCLMQKNPMGISQAMTTLLAKLCTAKSSAGDSTHHILQDDTYDHKTVAPTISPTRRKRDRAAISSSLARRLAFDDA